jgi:hypothetical protein
MIAAACEGAEKVLADTRKAYQFGTRQGPTTLPTLDKAQAAKILEQENLLRAAVNGGEGYYLNCRYLCTYLSVALVSRFFLEHLNFALLYLESIHAHISQ